jgi:glutamate/tyrosine decarboxylase-like PLP-dependent enzyme
MRKMGYRLPEFDLSVPGVTSISADMHKYGYAAKGASVVLYQDQTLRGFQFFASTETTGYALINPTMLSSKSGGPMAGSWAALNYLGEDGYEQIVKEVMNATETLIEGIKAIPDLRVLGNPAMCMFAIASETINVYQLADEMKKRGWYLQPQFTRGFSPRNLHVSISRGTVQTTAALLDDLRAGVEEVKKAAPVNMELVKMLVDQLMADASPETIQQLFAAAGFHGNQMPDETILINEVLDALPTPVANALLVAFFNGLYQ